MARTSGASLVLATLATCVAQTPVPGTQPCNTQELIACQNTTVKTEAALALVKSDANYDAMCAGVDTFERCIIMYGTNCADPIRITYKTALKGIRDRLNNEYGKDCSALTPQTTTQLLKASFGDSGSESNSLGSWKVYGSSSSNATKWQWWILAVLLLCSICVCIGGAVAALAKGGKGKKRSQKIERDFDYQEPPPEPQAPPMAPPAPVEAPMAPPPVLEQPAMVPEVMAQPAPDNEKLYLFGQPQPFLETIPTASMTGSGAEALSASFPMSSYYTQAPVGGSYYVQAAEQPSYYQYAAEQPSYYMPTASQYATTSYVANPGYATTGYAAGSVV